MRHQHQGFEIPSEAMAQQSKSSLEYDKSGQHTKSCVFTNRVFEPWPNQYLKTVLMECYIFRDKQKSLPGAWDCLIPSCDEHFTTFANAITHLDVCEHLKATTRQYTCPCCQEYVQVPAISHGNKTMLKIKRSLDNMLGRHSSAGSSPVASPISDAGPSQAGYEAAPMPNVADNIKFNTHAPMPFTQVNRNVPDPIITELATFPNQIYEACSNSAFPSSTTTNSSFGSGSYGIFTPQASSASSLSQHMWSSPCDTQHFGDFPCRSTSAEFPNDAFSQVITNMQVDGTNMGGMMSYPPLDSNGNVIYSNGNAIYSDVGQELQDKVTSFLQEWTQQGFVLAEMPVDVPQEPYDGLAIAAGAGTVHELFSPTPTDVSMTNTTPTSEGTCSPTTDSSSLECTEPLCGWKPDPTGNRSLAKLRQAVDKHFKRNHRSKDYSCPVCNQPFRNRPDNVKPHVARKHPEMLAQLYPKAAQDGSQCDKGTKAPATKRSGRHLRSKRAEALA